MWSIKHLTIDRKKFLWQVATILGVAILFTSPLSSAVQQLGMRYGIETPSLIESANAAEIYDMFTCPCCGKPLKKEEPCCGAMTQMIDYIDQKISAGASKDAVVLATAQEFGLDRLANETDRAGLRDKLLANAPKNSPKIVVTETKKDLGQVSAARGTVSTEFVIKNEGKSDLLIDKLSSSCGCTSGSVVYEGTEGPRFSMPGHGQEQPDESWQVAVAAGAEATIKVYYDPTVHPDLTGPVTRTVTIFSNDPVDFETKVTINLDQVR